MATSADFMERWFTRVWANEDEDAIDEMLVPEIRAVGLGKQPRIGPEQFKEFHRCFLKLMSDVDVVVDKRMQDGDWHAILVTFNARRRDNGEPVSMTGQVFCKIIDDRIVEGYNHFDLINLFEQLDLLPEDTLETCLQGKGPTG